MESKIHQDNFAHLRTLPRHLGAKLGHLEAMVGIYMIWCGILRITLRYLGVWWDLHGLAGNLAELPSHRGSILSNLEVMRPVFLGHAVRNQRTGALVARLVCLAPGMVCTILVLCLGILALC